jgi:hypothetical protein
MAAALDIVGVFEAAEILGLKPASFSHLRARSRGVEGSNFPAAAAELRMGPVWHRKDIDRFAKGYRAVKEAAAKKVEAKKAATAPKANGKAVAQKANGKAPAKKIAVARKKATAK